MRDKCFECLDSSHNRRKCQKVCNEFFSGKYCLNSWIKHYTKKKRYQNAWKFYSQQYERERIDTKVREELEKQKNAL